MMRATTALAAHAVRSWTRNSRSASPAAAPASPKRPAPVERGGEHEPAPPAHRAGWSGRGRRRRARRRRRLRPTARPGRGARLDRARPARRRARPGRRRPPPRRTGASPAARRRPAPPARRRLRAMVAATGLSACSKNAAPASRSRAASARRPSWATATDRLSRRRADQSSSPAAASTGPAPS